MRRYLLAMMLAAVLVACGCSNTSVQQPYWAGGLDPATQPMPVLPDDNLTGWQLATPQVPVEHYFDANLYLLLEEGADIYHGHEFRHLTHATYRFGLLGTPAAVIDAYEMSSPMGAYSVFTQLRNRADDVAAIGGGGHVNRAECMFWKGNHFVRVKLTSPVDSPEETLLLLAGKTAEKVPGTTDAPLLGAFPMEGRVPVGDTAHVKGLLGYDFLPGGLTVEYEVDGGKATMFVAVFSPTGEPGDPTTIAYLEMRDALRQVGAVPMVLPQPWERAFKATHPKLGQGLVTQKGGYIAGVFGVSSAETAERMTSQLVQGLR